MNSKYCREIKKLQSMKRTHKTLLYSVSTSSIKLQKLEPQPKAYSNF